MDNETVYQKLISGIKDYFTKNNFKKAVIGLSGGIDSSVSAKLVADAIGKENIHGLIMPYKGLSSEENIRDAIEFCKLNGINCSVQDITEFIIVFEKLKWMQPEITKMNTYSRIRAVILYNYANTHNALVIGTSNKSEILLGYFTKYGDGAVDIEVIGDLFKTEVKELAKFMKIPEKIINKVPTAELYHGQTDEDELGVTYEEIDKILKLYVNGNSMLNIIEKGDRKPTDNSNSVSGTNFVGFEKGKVGKIFQRIKANKHKLEMPITIKIF